MGKTYWTDDFITALARCGNVRMAARAVGVDHSTVYAKRNRDKDFAARWREAVDHVAREGARPLEDAAAHQEFEVQNGRSVRVGVGRFGKAARAAFLDELAATGSVARAAEACGFSTTALYRRRVKEKDFAEAWDAALQVGKARLEDLLMEAAQRQFDPDALPLGEGAPRVSTREALDILKHGGAKRGAAASEAGGVSPEEVAAARSRIAERLDRLAARIERDRLAAGYRKVGEDWIPPGWVPAQTR